jgi:hypothetical protein
MAHATKTQVHGSITFRTYEISGTPYAMAFRGKSEKPFKNYRFRNEAARSAWIADVVAEENAKIAYRAEKRVKMQAMKAEMIQRIEVGTLLVYSWGYDQTNIDIYEVTKKSGSAVEIREVCQELTQTGMMQGRVKAVPGVYTSAKPIKKRIGAYGISMPHGIASITTADATHYCSWDH